MMEMSLMIPTQSELFFPICGENVLSYGLLCVCLCVLTVKRSQGKKLHFGM